MNTRARARTHARTHTHTQSRFLANNADIYCRHVLIHQREKKFPDTRDQQQLTQVPYPARLRWKGSIGGPGKKNNNSLFSRQSCTPVGRERREQKVLGPHAAVILSTCRGSPGLPSRRQSIRSASQEQAKGEGQT